MVRAEPAPEWVAARDRGLLPEAVFAMYSRSSFFSFGAAPPFLADERRFLFSYFAMVLTSLRDALVDADGELRAFQEDQAQVYDPGKRIRGETWDPDGSRSCQEAFSASPDIPPSQPGRDRGSCRSLPHRSDSGAPSRARPVFAHRDVVGPCSAASWIDHYASTGFLGTAVCDVVTSRQRRSSGAGMVTANADVPQQGRAPRWRRLPLHGIT